MSEEVSPTATDPKTNVIEVPRADVVSESDESSMGSRPWLMSGEQRKKVYP